MDAASHITGIYVFGPYRLDPTRRTLTRDGVPVHLAARPFDVLLLLVENLGAPVSKAALQAAVWGGRIVEDGNVPQTIFALRRALQTEETGDRLIVTVAGQGYCLALPVRRESAPAAAVAPARAAAFGRSRLVLACGALLAAGAAVLALLPRAPPPAAFAPPPYSVAVLPFANMSGDAGQDYIGDGLSEELIGALGEVGQMRVVARTSSFSFRGSHAAVAEIARRLNVGAVLEGSVRHDGARLRITAQLIDAVSGFHLWSHDYDRPAGDVLHLQTDIAAEVTRALKLTLLGEDVAKMTLGGTDNPAAFDAYLRAMRLKHQMDPSNAKTVLAACDEALRADPRFALAQVLRARILIGIAEGFDTNHGNVAALHAAARDAMAAAELAVRLAPDLAGAHAAIGSAALDAWDFRRASAEFARALQLAPNNAAILMDDAWLHALLGHSGRAVAQARHAVDLNPLAASAQVDFIWTLLWANQPAAAARALHYAEELGVSHLLATYLRGRIALARGDAAAAREICAKGEDWKQLYCLAIADHALGHDDAAASGLARLRALMGDSAAFQYADIYAQWGQTDAALAALEHAYDLRDTGLMEIQVDPFLFPLRTRQRFRDVVARMAFPP
jgi:TolB-like protein/DNA-binding winged helix-turn-helix (wHTH) protein